MSLEFQRFALFLSVRAIRHIPSCNSLTMSIERFSPFYQSTQSPSHQPDINRTMSLRAALLAFPLPSPPTNKASQEIKPRISPLKTYNSNYSRLTRARALRLQQRKSTNNEPIYAMPTSYNSIQQEFPSSSTHVQPRTSTCGSMNVEIDDTPSFSIFEDPPVTTLNRRSTRRATLLSSGSIATRQHVRKIAKRKHPKEISVNILRHTGNFVGRGLLGGIQKAKETFSATGEGIMKRIVKSKSKRNEDGGDGLHKFIYDLHGSGYAESANSEGGLFANDMDDVRSFGENIIPNDNGSFDVIPNGDFNGKLTRNDDFGANYSEDFVSGGYVTGMRRQTWTNLTSVLMNEDTRMEDENIVPEKEIAEEETTIEEFREISHCGHKPNTEISTEEHPSEYPKAVTPRQTMAGYLQSLAMALNSKSQSPDTTIFHPEESDAQKSSFEEPKWELTSGERSLRQLSPETQDIFDITRAETIYFSGISDPVKPSTSTVSTHPNSGVEITLPSSSSQYSDILSREVSYTKPSYRQHSYEQPSYPSSRQHSHSSLLQERPSSEGQLWKRKVSEQVFRHVSNRPSLDENLEVDQSTSAIELWKSNFGVEDANQQEEDEFYAGKSVKERVKELDMAIDSASSFGSPAKKVRGILGRWR